MAAHKAPDPDGFPPRFFQQFWHVIGPSMIAVIMQFFQEGQLWHDINESLLYLLLKIANSKTLTQFQLISLCNVLVKIVSKNHCKSIEAIDV